MNIFRKIIDAFRSVKAWFTSRKVRRVRRAATAAADTAAAGVGLALRLGAKLVITLLLVFLTTGLLLMCIFAMYVKTCLTEEMLDLTPEELTSAMSSHILVETSVGSDQWQEIAVLYSDENRVPIDYDQIPLNLEHAAVAIEDARFYRHKGVDWYRTVGAFVNMFLGMRNNFGGSTITQQLIKNLTGKDDITVQRKLLEIFQALEFEKKYDKEEIINWYLNEIYLGEQCYGVQAAAQVYFGKDVWDLSLAECAGLVGITNNPSMYDPYFNPENFEKRRNLILWEMYDQGYISYDAYLTAKEEPVNLDWSEEDEEESSVFSYYVDSVIWDVVADLAEERNVSEDTAWRLLYNSGYNIYVCMDQRIQNIVDSIYQNVSGLPQPYRSASQKLSSAIVIIDPYDGRIVALAGDTGVKQYSLSGNYATRLRRQPGSSFKPVAVYGPALDLGLISPSDQVNDSPNVSLKGTSWYPRNDGNYYSGWISLRMAVVLSRNTIAAQVLDKLGLQASWDYLTNHFGFTSLERDHIDSVTGSVVSDYNYSPLALGQLSYGVTVREMAQAYTAFVNDGVMTYGRTYSKITDSEGNIVLDNSPNQISALKPNTARNMTAILEEAVNNSSGTGRNAYFSTTAIAGKTGTTTESMNRYFVGYTRYYVAAVWTGYATPERMYFSYNPAVQLWRSVMTKVHSGFDYWAFQTPTASTATNILSGTGTPTPKPTESPEPSVTPEPSPTPDNDAPPPMETPTATPPVTEAPVVTPEPPVATEVPVVPTEPQATAQPTVSPSPTPDFEAPPPGVD